MSNKNSMQKLDSVVIVHLDFSIWSAMKKLKEGDLQILNLPSDGVNLGTKLISDKSKLKVFHAIKRNAERICRANGIKFIGGYALPIACAKEVSNELDSVIDMFHDAKAEYLANHERYQQEYIALKAKELPVLNGLRVKSSEVAGKIRADYTMFRINPSGIGSSDESLDSQVDGMTQTLDGDINSKAEELVDRFIADKGAISSTIVGHLDALKEKIKGLAFLDPKYDVVVDNISRIQSQIPPGRKKKMLNLPPQVSFALMGLLEHLSKPELMQSLIDGKSEISSGFEVQVDTPVQRQSEDKKVAEATLIAHILCDELGIGECGRVEPAEVVEPDELGIGECGRVEPAEVVEPDELSGELGFAINEGSFNDMLDDFSFGEVVAGDDAVSHESLGFTDSMEIDLDLDD